MAARCLALHAGRSKYWLSICNCEVKNPKYPSLFYLQVHIMTSLPLYLDFGSLCIIFDKSTITISWTPGSFGCFIFSHGLFINFSQNWKARVAGIAPVDKLVCCWYSFDFSFFSFCVNFLITFKHFIKVEPLYYIFLIPSQNTQLFTCQLFFPLFLLNWLIWYGQGHLNFLYFWSLDWN